MKVKFDDAMTNQEIWAVGTELATVMGCDRNEEGKRVYSWPDTEQLLVSTLGDPVLMTDMYKISHIQDFTKRIAVEILLTKSEREVEFDGFSMKWQNSNQYPGMWFPSIDTIFFCSCVKDQDFSHVKKMIEIGSGPGFMGKYLKTKCPNLKQLVLNDINQSAKKYHEDVNKDAQIEFVLSDGMVALGDQKFDLIISNPPYIPRPKSVDDNPYEGLSLVTDMIHSLDKNLSENGALMIVVPNLADDILYPVFEKCDLRVEELGRREVPLKVSNILMNKEWLQYLLEEKGLVYQPRDGYDYRQTIKVLKISR